MKVVYSMKRFNLTAGILNGNYFITGWHVIGDSVIQYGIAVAGTAVSQEKGRPLPFRLIFASSASACVDSLLTISSHSPISL